MAFLSDPTFWTLVAFVVFFGLIGRPVGKLVVTALDKRADGIRDEIDEAEKLREDAQDLLATYQKRQRDAARDAEAILEHAREEASRLAAEGEEQLAQALKRRERLALDRIGQAETAALDQIRALTVDIALEAAEKVMAGSLKGKKAGALIDAAIKNIPGNLN